MPVPSTQQRPTARSSKPIAPAAGRTTATRAAFMRRASRPAAPAARRTVSRSRSWRGPRPTSRIHGALAARARQGQQRRCLGREVRPADGRGRGTARIGAQGGGQGRQVGGLLDLQDGEDDEVGDGARGARVGDAEAHGGNPPVADRKTARADGSRLVAYLRAMLAPAAGNASAALRRSRPRRDGTGAAGAIPGTTSPGPRGRARPSPGRGAGWRRPRPATWTGSPRRPSSSGRGSP